MPNDTKKILSETAAVCEAFLLAEGGPIQFQKLATLLHRDEAAVQLALAEISLTLEDSGMSLVYTSVGVALATAPRTSEALRKAYEDTLSRDVGSAGLEVLTVLLYRGPSTRSRIDYIRGVNTSSTIRLLMSRGLIERSLNPADSREYLYLPTVELLAHLGVRTVSELPDYDTIRSELESFEKTQAATDHGDTSFSNDG